MIDQLKQMIGESVHIDDTIALVKAYWALKSESDYEEAYEVLDRHEVQGDCAWFLHARDLVEPYCEHTLVPDLRLIIHDLRPCEGFLRCFHALHSALLYIDQGDHERAWTNVRKCTDELEESDPLHKKLTDIERRLQP